CTGALHLDGLADTVDGWVGGRADPERTFAIMKDPCSGPVAVAAVVCLLLLKFGALSALRAARGTVSSSDLHFACGCILPPLLARAAVPPLFAHTPYVRAGGIGADPARSQSRPRGRRLAALRSLARVLACGRYALVAS